MKRLIVAFLSAALSCAPGILFAQQQSPNKSGPPQNSQDVPHQQPGTNNPDLATQRHPTPGDTSDTGAQSHSNSNSHSKKKRGRTKHTSASTSTSGTS